MLKEYSFPLVLAAGLLIGYALVWRCRSRVGIKSWWGCLLLCLCYLWVSLLSVKLFAWLEGVITGSGTTGVSTYGVYFLAAPVLLGIGALLPVRTDDFFDLYALYALPTLFLCRCLCIVSGCCGGITLGGFQVPVREFELVFYVLFFGYLWKQYGKDQRRGMLFPLLMTGYGVFRFFNEWFRVGTPVLSGLHLAHIWSLLCAGMGCSIYFAMKGRARKRAHKLVRR